MASDVTASNIKWRRRIVLTNNCNFRRGRYICLKEGRQLRGRGHRWDWLRPHFRFGMSRPTAHRGDIIYCDLYWLIRMQWPWMVKIPRIWKTVLWPSSVVTCSTDYNVNRNNVSSTRPFVWRYLRMKFTYTGRTASKCESKPLIAIYTLRKGRVDPTMPRDLIDLLAVNEITAALDPAWHISSFFSDVSRLTCRCLMKTIDWQQ